MYTTPGAEITAEDVAHFCGDALALCCIGRNVEEIQLASEVEALQIEHFQSLTPVPNDWTYEDPKKFHPNAPDFLISIWKAGIELVRKDPEFADAH